MSKAILKGLLRTPSTTPTAPLISDFVVSVTSPSSVSKLEAELAGHADRVRILCNQNLQAVQEADAVLFGFPPDQLENVLSNPGVARAVESKFIVSILAGVSQRRIRDLLSTHGGRSRENDNSSTSTTPTPIVRALPSMGAQALESSTLLVDEEPRLPAQLAALAHAIFSPIGAVHTIPASLFTPLTALNGVCHALLSVSFDAIADAAVASGVPRPDALSVAAQCFVGYARLVAQGREPVDLKNSLLIPRGLTVQAMLALERGGMRTALHDAVKETVAYTAGMGKEGKDKEEGEEGEEK